MITLLRARINRISSLVGVLRPGKENQNYTAAVCRALTGLAKGQKRGVDPTALVEYKIYLPAMHACQALDRAMPGRRHDASAKLILTILILILIGCAQG